MDSAVDYDGGGGEGGGGGGVVFFFNDTATTEIYTLSLHDALPIFFERDASLIEIVTSLWRGESWPLAILVGAFSIGLPVLKLIYLAVTALVPRLSQSSGPMAFQIGRAHV